MRLLSARASEAMDLYRYLFAPVLVAVAVWLGHHRPPPRAQAPRPAASRPVQAAPEQRAAQPAAPASARPIAIAR